VNRVQDWIDERWDWRLSGHCRMASLGSVWVLAFAMGGPARVILPFTILRSVASVLQSVLNIRLGRVQPVGSPARFDWLLMGSIFAAAYAVAGLHQYGHVALSAVVLLPMLVPFSVLQARMCLRSYRTPRRRTPTQAAVIRLERFSRARPEAA
jgi:hypothetical protein